MKQIKTGLPGKGQNREDQKVDFESGGSENELKGMSRSSSLTTASLCGQLISHRASLSVQTIRLIYLQWRLLARS